MQRRKFVQGTALIGAGAFLNPFSINSIYAAADFPIVRTPSSKRNFESKAIEAAIKEFKSK